MFDIYIRVISKNDLIEYKSRVNREVDIIDIEQMKD